MDFYTHMAIESATRAAEKIFGPAKNATTLTPHRIDEIDPPANVVLENYTNKEASEDGTYVIIKDHQEWVQGIPQPRTPAEIEMDLRSEELRLGKLRKYSQIALGVGLGLLGVGAVVISKKGIVRQIPVIVPVEKSE